MTVIHDPRPTLTRLKFPEGFVPTWDLLAGFPEQGHWTESDYLALEKIDTHRRFELVNGRLEVLAVPTEEHQLILLFLLDQLRAVVEPGKLGKVLFAGLRVRLR